MNFVGLCELMNKFKYPTTYINDNLKVRATELALDIFGPTVYQLNGLINISALFLSGGAKTIHKLSSSINSVVNDTDLYQYPDTCPIFMDKAGIIEAKHTDMPLFGETVSLGWYWIDNDLFLVGINYPDGFLMAKTTPFWSGKEITGHSGDYQIEFLKDIIDSWAIKALRFLIVYSLLLEAENTPFFITKKDKFIYRVIIDKKHTYLSEPKKLSEIIVRGHLRHQAFGPKHSLRKWIWISEHSVRRWII